ncbi:MAG: membrane protein insertion efficiency factor YidD [Acidobacteriota bacterium]
MMKRALLGLLTFYKRYLSPLLPRSCRFTPTCSEYAHLAISRYGGLRGSYMTLKRLFKCHPLHPGGVDIP